MITLKMPDSFESALDGIDEKISEHVLRSSAHAGALVFYEEAKTRAPVLDDSRMPHYWKAGKLSKPGQLRDAIYRKFSEERSGDKNKIYHVSWNHKSAPHGHLIENGHFKVTQKKNGKRVVGFVPPVPFIRGSFNRAGDVVQAMTERAAERMDQVIAELAAEAGK